MDDNSEKDHIHGRIGQMLMGPDVSVKLNVESLTTVPALMPIRK